MDFTASLWRLSRDNTLQRLAISGFFFIYFVNSRGTDFVRRHLIYSLPYQLTADYPSNRGIRIVVAPALDIAAGNN